VADQHKGGPRGFQVIFQPANRFNIEVVGRLVQQHQFRVMGEKPCEGGAATLAPRCVGHFGVEVQFQPLGGHVDLIHLRRVQQLEAKIAQRGETLQRWFLFHIADLGAGGRRTTLPRSASTSPAITFIKVDLPEPLRPTSATRSPGLDHEPKLGEHRITAESQRDVGEL